MSGQRKWCLVGYCWSDAGHGTPHDIAPCLRTCGPLRPGKGRKHDPACRNAEYLRVRLGQQFGVRQSESASAPVVSP